jgi:diguanylate cyclase (GGDEF)-like protein
MPTELIALPLLSMELSALLAVGFLFVTLGFPGRIPGLGVGACALLAHAVCIGVSVAQPGWPTPWIAGISSGLGGLAVVLTLGAVLLTQRRVVSWEMLSMLVLSMAFLGAALHDAPDTRMALGALPLLVILGWLVGVLMAPPESQLMGRARWLMVLGSLAVMLAQAIGLVMLWVDAPSSVMSAMHLAQGVEAMGVLVLSLAFVLLVLENLQLRLEETSRSDGLTGVRNRLSLLGTLKIVLSQSSRSRMPVTVMAVSIDHLAELDRKYGRHSGDKVLSHTAQMLVHNLRRHDRIGRFDADTFLLVLPDTPAVGAHVVAHKLLKAAAAQSVEVGSKSKPSIIGYTLSIGNLIATPSHRDEAALMASMAIRGMRHAREAGGNQIYVLPHDPALPVESTELAAEDQVDFASSRPAN